MYTCCNMVITVVRGGKLGNRPQNKRNFRIYITDHICTERLANRFRRRAEIRADVGKASPPVEVLSYQRWKLRRSPSCVSYRDIFSVASWKMYSNPNSCQVASWKM